MKICYDKGKSVLEQRKFGQVFFNFRCEKVLMTRPPFCVLYLGQVLHIQNVFKRKQENKITKTLSDTELESRM